MSNLVFVHLPKTGGTSIGKYLSTCGVPVVNLSHNTARGFCRLGCCWKMGDKLSKIPPDPFFFGFVRNPWEWYVSRYFYFRRQTITERGLSKGFDLGVRGQHQSFSEHLLAHEDNSRFWMSHLYRHLFTSRNDENGELLLGFVGRTETVAASLDDLFKRLKLKPRETYAQWDAKNLQYRNASQYEHYSCYYDDQLRDLVAEKDRQIIETYGYQWESA